MTSISPALGEIYYIPFWVLLEYLDNTPSDPFLQVRVINLKSLSSTTTDGVQAVACCDIECLSRLDKKTSFNVSNVPVDYLIEATSLKTWASRISQWFLEYPDHIKS